MWWRRRRGRQLGTAPPGPQGGGGPGAGVSSHGLHYGGVILEVVEQEDNLAAAVVAARALAATRGDGAVVGQGTAADPGSSTAHGAPSSSRNEPASAAGSPKPAELCNCGRLLARSGRRANQMCCAHCPSSHSDTCQRRERRRLKNAPPPPPPPSQPRS